MRKNVFRWVWYHRKLIAGLTLAVGIAALNLVACMHARAMTHFTQSGAKTSNPESLSASQKIRVLLTGVTVPRPVNDVSPDSLGLNFEVHDVLVGSGTKLEAWYIPRDQPRGLVVMFHGYASCKREILQEANAFHELGYASFLVDFRGSGGSSGRDTSIGVYEADDVAKSCEYVRGRWADQPMILFGQSMGSAAVLRAMAVHDLRPNALVLECPFDRLISTVENRFSAMRLPAFPMAHLLVFWGGVQQGFNGFRHNPVDYAKSVSVPVLMLQGDRDTRVTRAQAEEVFRNLAGVKQFDVFAGLGHESFVAHNATQWKRVVSGFLKE